MAEDRRDDSLYWIDPEWRGILPLDKFHIPKKTVKLIRQERFEIKVNTSFREVVLACAETSPGREKTWINNKIINLYTDLHAQNHAHSVEIWYEGKLAGGLYGVQLKAAFFGESMFSKITDASKVALAYLVGRLIYGGFRLLDTQFVTDHLSQFGALEVPRAEYHRQLYLALDSEADFHDLPANYSSADLLQLISQTS